MIRSQSESTQVYLVPGKGLRIPVTIIQFRPILTLALSLHPPKTPPSVFFFHSGHKSPLWEDKYANESEKRNRRESQVRSQMQGLMESLSNSTRYFIPCPLFTLTPFEIFTMDTNGLKLLSVSPQQCQSIRNVRYACFLFSHSQPGSLCSQHAHRTLRMINHSCGCLPTNPVGLFCAFHSYRHSRT